MDKPIKDGYNIIQTLLSQHMEKADQPKKQLIFISCTWRTPSRWQTFIIIHRVLLALFLSNAISKSFRHLFPAYATVVPHHANNIATTARDTRYPEDIETILGTDEEAIVKLQKAIHKVRQTLYTW